MLEAAYDIAKTGRAVQPQRPSRAGWALAGVASLMLLLLPFVFKLDGKAHADWQQFLGRFHPLIVHLPIGLIVLVPLLEMGGRFRPALREAAGFVLALGAAACVGAVCLGYLLAYGAGTAGAVLTRHMWGGISLTIGMFICCLLRPAWVSGQGSRGWSMVYPAALGTIFLLLSWAAHQGGSLTHGENYLLEYLPGPLKRLLPAGPPKPLAALAPASFYARHIHPMLDARCAACHGEGNVKGGLRVDTYERLLKGGREGPVIVAGQPEKSPLLERVLLPSDHKKFMPAEGRTPLKPEEIVWLKAWIAQGASATATTLTGLALDDRVEEAQPAPVGDYRALQAAMKQTAAAAGVTLTPVSRNAGDGLILNAVDASGSFTDAQLAAFLLYAPYIVEMELGRTSVTDGCVATLAKFPHLRAIHLEGTKITGEGLSILTQLPELDYLNLTGTQVTAAAVQPLASSKTLRHLYLYNTPAQPASGTPGDGASGETRASESHMNPHPATTGALNRRRFLGLSTAAAAAEMFAQTGSAQKSGRAAHSAPARTGNGEWTCRTVPGWGELPPGTTFGGTHGAIATDKAGSLYVSTQSATGILVYDHGGKLQRTIASAYPEVHSMVHAEEEGRELFYVTVQKGTPGENWLFLKLRTDGAVAQKITAPPEAGFHAPDEWKLTAAVPGPDGSIYIANGYGDSRIFKFDREGNYRSAFAGKGDGDGQCNCCHGMAVDTRYDQPLLLVCDRENRRLTHFDFDGKFVAHHALNLRRPCQISFHGDQAIVSELEGRVTVLDKKGTPVAFLGDNPDPAQWANYKLRPEEIAPAYFSAAHGCFVDREAGIYISDWNQSGRVTKLVRTNALS